ncbi:MAG TPA: ribonuclease HI family protein [Myxococcales bacterium]|nr:ribonuclease HI family protein [Myxococcales bacterium]
MSTDAEILAAIAGAEDFEKTLERHPGLTRAAILACLRRAAASSGRKDGVRTEAAPPVQAPPPHRSGVDGHERVRIYSDGAARGNPGPAGAGAIVASADGQVIARLGRYLGEATNNFAEYQGLLLGLRRAAELGARDVEIFADSQLMIRQLGGQYRVRNEGLRPLFDEALRLLRGFRKFELHHIPRERNAAADEMSNRAIDERM